MSQVRAPGLAGRRLFPAAAGLVALVAATAGVVWMAMPEGEAVLMPERPAPSVEDGEPGFRPQRFQPKSPPLGDPTVRPVADVGRAVADSELVVGVTVGGESRAYSLDMMSDPSREVINDTLGGRPIAVTWCSLCQSAVVYDREVDGQVLTFGVSGMRWNDNLLMYDRETDSYWGQVPGTCRFGPLKGKTLRRLPSVMTTWRTWADVHPGGTALVLSRASTIFRKESYQHPEAFVLGIAVEGRAKAWAFDPRGRAHAIDSEWDGRPVLAAFAPDGVSARLFARSAGDRTLTFLLEGGRLTDRETGSVWDPVSGRAESGPLAGEHLEPLPAVVMFRQAWQASYPDAPIEPAHPAEAPSAAVEAGDTTVAH